MKIPGSYSQRDSRWSSNLLGYNSDRNYNLYSYGCLVTTLSNLYWYTGHNIDPGSLNEWLKQHGGFQQGGGNLVWGVVPQFTSDVVAQGEIFSLDAANTYAGPEGHFAVLRVQKALFPMHYVLLVRQNVIIDPWDGKEKSWGSSGYQFVTAHLYGDKTPDFATAPQPSTASQPIKPQGDDEMPIQPDDVNDLSLTLVGHPRGAGEDQFIGKPWHEAYYGIKDSQPARDYLHSKQQEVNGLKARVAELESKLVPVEEAPEPPVIVPVKPEYEASYRENRYAAVTTSEAFAVDMTSQNPPVQVPQGTKVEVAGIFVSDGREYTRSVMAAEKGWWYGLPITAFNPPSQEVQVTKLEPEDKIELPEEKPSKLIRFFTVVAKVFSPLLKRLNRSK